MSVRRFNVCASLQNKTVFLLCRAVHLHFFSQPLQTGRSHKAEMWVPVLWLKSHLMWMPWVGKQSHKGWNTPSFVCDFFSPLSDIVAGLIAQITLRLPVSVSCPVYRNINKERSLLSVSVSMCISSVNLEWRSHEPKTYTRVPIMTENILVIIRKEFMYV